MSKTVLLVEDDLQQQKLWSVIFKKLSQAVSVKAVTTVEAALEALSAKTHQPFHRAFDLILCDVYLEGKKTGVDLQRICETRFPGLPFILTSSMTAEELAKNFGYDPKKAPTYLPKQSGMGQLQETIRQHLLKTSIELGHITELPSASQLLAGISVALGLTAAVMQTKLPDESGSSGRMASAPISAKVSQTPLVEALQDQSVKDATADLLKNGLSPWIIAQNQQGKVKKRK